MDENSRDLHIVREQIANARAEALRLDNTRLGALLLKSIAGIELTIAELDESYARTLPRIEALKRLVGAM